jgi:hypothetical protein
LICLINESISRTERLAECRFTLGVRAHDPSPCGPTCPRASPMMRLLQERSVTTVKRAAPPCHRAVMAERGGGAGGGIDAELGMRVVGMRRRPWWRAVVRRGGGGSASSVSNRRAEPEGGRRQRLMRKRRVTTTRISSRNRSTSHVADDGSVRNPSRHRAVLSRTHGTLNLSLSTLVHR